MGKVVIILLIISSLYSTTTYETIFDGNCRACHNMVDEDSAPFIKTIVKRYKARYHKQREFVSHLSAWVEKPNKKSSLFPKAIKYYGLMPELGLDKDTLKGIANYLYKNF